MSDVIKGNMGMFNPADMASMKKDASMGSGPFAGMSKDTTVRDFFGKLGVDVDGPVSQLTELAKSQVQKSNPLSKMGNIAKSPVPGGGQPSAQPPMPEQAGLEGLMK